MVIDYFEKANVSIFIGFFVNYLYNLYLIKIKSCHYHFIKRLDNFIL